MTKFQAPNYTQVPNYVIDELMSQVSNAQFKCLMLIIRETFGFHRRRAPISFKEFQIKTKLSRQGAINATVALERAGLVIVHRDGNRTDEYELSIEELCSKPKTKERQSSQLSRPVKSTQLTAPSKLSRPFYREAKETIKETSKKTIVRGGGNVDNSKALEPPPNSTVSFSTENSIVFFDPSKYRLADGSPLSIRTQRAFAKYMNTDPERLLRCVRYYEEQVAKGIKPKTTHEVWLQGILKADYPSKEDTSWKNRLYAQFQNQELKIPGVKILKTVVQIQMGKDKETIPFSLSEKEFIRLFEYTVSKLKNGF